MQLILFGAPGVGKGTQAKLLAAKLQVPHISTGDILRGAIAAENELGQKTKKIVEAGELVPDEIMGKIVHDRLEKEDCNNGFILDGFPRTPNQAELLNDILKSKGNSSIVILKLTAADNVIIDRITSRRNCSNCKVIVNLHQLEDKTKCPNCGKTGTFLQREDDTEAVIRHRLEVFGNQTRPVLEYYKDKCDIIYVESLGSVAEINKKIMSKLNEYA